MRRLASVVMYFGVFGAVVGLSQFHASVVGDYRLTGSSRFAWALLYCGLLCVSAYGWGLPEVPRTSRSRLPSSIVAPATGALAISAVQLFAGDALLPRFVVFGVALILVPWFFLASTLSGAGRSAMELRDRVFVVGPEELEEELVAELVRSPEKPASVVGQLSEVAAGHCEDERRPLLDAVQRSGATVLVLSGHAQTDVSIIEQAAVLHEAGMRVRTHSLFYEEWLGKIPVADLGRVSLFFDIGEVHRYRFGRMKRLFDIFAALVGLTFLLVCVPVVAAINQLANRGPLFYMQDRVGKGGAVFSIAKFRSMVVHEGPTDWTQVDDLRITPFGRLMRRSHLDELPQVWNILKGDLSVVGPRPEQPRYVTALVDQLPFYDLRHIVRPGLTGWAQVKYGYAGDERDALQKLQYDFHYLRRQSIGFDLRIVARTIRSVLGIGGEGR